MPFQSSSNSKPRSGRVGTSSNQPPIHLKSADHQPFQLQLINALQYVSHQRLNSWRRADWQISSNPAQLEAIFCRQLRFWVTRCFGETFANIIINIMEARVVGQSKVDSAWKIRAWSYVSRYPTPHCRTRCLSASIFVFPAQNDQRHCLYWNAFAFLLLLISFDFIPWRRLRNISVVITSERAQ